MTKSHFDSDSALEKQLNLKILVELGKQGAEIQYPVPGTNEYSDKKDKSGIDAIFAAPDLFGADGFKNVDFKSATSWVAKYKKPGIKTFAFELSFVNKFNHVRDGWLFGNHYEKTEYYCLQWLWKKQGVYSENKLQVDDIGHIESLVISKEKIREYARKVNVHEYNYKDLSRWLASKTRNIERYYENSATKLVVYPKKSELNLQPDRVDNYARLVCSKNLQECPVNLLIPKEDLIEIAEEKAYFSYDV